MAFFIILKISRLLTSYKTKCPSSPERTRCDFVLWYISSFLWLQWSCFIWFFLMPTDPIQFHCFVHRHYQAEFVEGVTIENICIQWILSKKVTPEKVLKKCAWDLLLIHQLLLLNCWILYWWNGLARCFELVEHFAAEIKNVQAVCLIILN